MTCLTVIANRHGTDKGSISKVGHGYTLIYDLLFRELRYKPINILEIGLSAGGPEMGADPNRTVISTPSVAMWHDYFPSAHVFGMDISDCSQFENDWFRFFRADCGKADDLKQVAESGIQFDIIVDDGSHASYHQQLTLRILFPCLKLGGIYSIEDLDWQPTDYERTLPPAKRTAELLQSSNCEFPAILFYEDELMRLRHHFNKLHRLTPEVPHFVDRPTLRGRIRRLLRGSYAKLAIIPKLQ